MGPQPPETTMDAMHGDLTRAPLAYPLAAVAGPRLLLAHCEHAVRPRGGGPLGTAPTASCARCSAETDRPTAARRLDAALADLGATPLADRTPVLAVGSNAATAVVRHKLGSRGVSTVVPVLTGVAAGMVVGHSAHVARGGYVPAAPVHRSSARSRVVLQLLDEDQLAAVDETEPNYDRVQLSSRHYPVLLSGGVRPSRVHVYASRRGVLDLPGPGPTPLLPQHEVLAALETAGVPHTSGAPAEATARLARSPEVRERVRQALRERGLVRESGLHTVPAEDLRWADVDGRQRVRSPRSNRPARGPRPRITRRR